MVILAQPPVEQLPVLDQLIEKLPVWVEKLTALWTGLGSEWQLLIWAVILYGTLAGLGQVAVVFMVLMERKVLAWMTQRKGPNRVGPWGILQTVADGIKLLFKEDIMTPAQDKLMFTLGPAIFFLPAFVVYAFIPFSDELVGLALPVGALLFFALSSLSVVGIVMSGWASNNKYSLLGGMRSAAQAISYEIPLVMSVLAVVVFTGSMNLNDIVAAQNNHVLGWFWFLLTPVTFLIFYTSSIAEVNRVPFDLPEAESELVSGYNTEYSGMKFAMFFLAEYASLFAMSALTATLFFGGYYSPLGGLLISMTGLDLVIEDALKVPGIAHVLQQLEMVSWLMIKTYFFIFVAMWLRGTLPRLKPDQLMGFSWKFLIPLSLVNVFVIAMERLWIDRIGQNEQYIFLAVWLISMAVGYGGFSQLMSTIFTDKLQARLTKREA